MIRRITALMLTLALLFGCMSFAAAAAKKQSRIVDEDTEDSSSDSEDEEEISPEEKKELEDLDAVSDEDEQQTYTGNEYHEKSLSDFDVNSPALYKARLQAGSSLFSDRSLESPRVCANNDSVGCDILYVGVVWIIARIGDKIGYCKRDRLISSTIVTVDPVNTPPYGAQKPKWIATTAKTCPVRKSMSLNDKNTWVVLKPGTRLSIWRVQDGWGIVIYWRNYGYIDMNDLTDLIPVSPTDDKLADDIPIAAYTSFYSMADTEINRNRHVNIDVGCKRLTRVLQPGESFDFNADVGPYKRALGYLPAYVLVDGKSVPGYGGGTCQVSSTLYNALIQCPGIEILQRRPHGPGGARYLPHGVDAAVGNKTLNLRFRNNYSFPIRIEGHTNYDGALLMLVYRAD